MALEGQEQGEEEGGSLAGRAVPHCSRTKEQRLWGRHVWGAPEHWSWAVLLGRPELSWLPGPALLTLPSTHREAAQGLALILSIEGRWGEG